MRSIDRAARTKEQKMTDRLRNALSSLEQLPPQAQEEAATYIEALVEAFKLALTIQSYTKDAPSQESTNAK